jgi:hypothetical protein
MRKEKTALQKINWRAGLWVTALIFLSNPNFHALDLLPDAIGYLLLIVALRRVSALDESFAEVARAFRRMAWLSVARGVGLVWALTLASASEKPVLLLVISFALGVLELMTILPACSQLFKGLSYLATRLDGKIVFEGARTRRIARLTAKLRHAEEMGTWDVGRRQKLDRRIRRLARHQREDITDRVCFSCQLFAVLKTALCVLPELSSLSNASYEAGAIRVNWYNYINLFRVFAMFVGIIVGTIWLVRMITYCTRIAGDTLLWERLLVKCEEDELAHPERVPARRMRWAIAWLTVACVFHANLYFEGFNILPSFLAPVALIALLLTLWRYLPRKLCYIGLPVFALHAVMSVYTYFSIVKFYAENEIFRVALQFHVREQYNRLVITPSVWEAAFALLSFAVVVVVLWVVIHRYTGSHGAGSYRYTVEELLRIRRSQLGRILLLPLALAVVSIGCHVAYFYLLPKHAMFWIIDILVAAALTVFTNLRLRDVRDDLDMMRMVDAKNQ